MSVRAPVGELNRADQNYAIGRGIAALKAKEVDPDFLYYGLYRWRQSFQRLGQGSTFEAITTRQLKQVIVALPENTEEQRRIAGALKLADEAIAKVQGELEAAQELKASLLRFVFRTGLSTPSGLHESKWITCPAHWDIKPLKAFAKVAAGFTMGRDLSRFETVEVPYVTVVNVQEGRFDLSAISSIQIKPEELETDLLEHGDILMTEGGDRDKLGRGGMWRADVAPCSYQNHIFRVRLDRGVYKPELFHFLIQTFQAKNYFYAHAKQTSNLCTINSRELKKWPVPIPPRNEQEKMIEVLDAIEKQQWAIWYKVLTLQDLKKSLLHNLLTGKIRLPEGVIHG
jgi:type I restriction enzyme S subunit